MRPVVNGLAQTYGDEVDFRSHNIASQEGQAWAEQYGLRGHPAYVLLDARGNESWRAVGVVPGGAIEAEITAVLRSTQVP